MILSQDDVQAARFPHRWVQLDIGAAAGHVGRDGDPSRRTGAGYELGHGANVARMVAGLSDTLAEDHDKKEGWEERKHAYLERLRGETDDVLLISAADKLYNAKSILDDHRVIGDAVWERFKRGSDKQLGYINELLAIFRTHPTNKIVDDFERVVHELTERVRAH